MILHQDTQTRERVGSAFQPLLDALQDEGKRVTLNAVEQTLFTVEVIIEAGERHACSPADVSHGTGFKAMFREYLRGMTKNVLELGFGVAGKWGGLRHKTYYRTFVR